MPGCRNRRHCQDTRPSPWPPRDPPGWWRRSRDRWAPSWVRRRGARLAPAVLHGRKHAAQDVDFVLIELGTLQETADARHQVRAALSAIAEIDLLQHLCEMQIESVH